MSEIRVFLVDDHSIVRQGLRLLIDRQPGMCVVGEYDHGRGVADAVNPDEVDVVVMDVSMPDLSGTEAAASLRRRHPYVKIVGLSRHAEKAYVQQMMEAGATGYVLKQTAAEVLLEAIRSVAGGRTYIDPAISGQSNAASPRRPQAAGGDASLTSREQEIVTMVAFGHTNKEIGATLGIAVKTVESHKNNVMQKLGLTSRADLVRFALSQNWLDR